MTLSWVSYRKVSAAPRRAAWRLARQVAELYETQRGVITRRTRSLGGHEMCCGITTWIRGRGWVMRECEVWEAWVCIRCRGRARWHSLTPRWDRCGSAHNKSCHSLGRMAKGRESVGYASLGWPRTRTAGEWWGRRFIRKMFGMVFLSGRRGVKEP